MEDRVCRAEENFSQLMESISKDIDVGNGLISRLDAFINGNSPCECASTNEAPQPFSGIIDWAKEIRRSINVMDKRLDELLSKTGF